MSRFSDDMSAAFDLLIEQHGDSITYTHALTQTAETLSAVTVEDVGANDPFAERTYIFQLADFAEDPTNGDVITDGGVPWVVQKIRNTEDGTYEIRTRAPEEAV